MIQLQIKASMDPGSMDMWSPYRLTQAQLGPRILEIMEGLRGQAGASRQAADLIALTGVVWLHQPAVETKARGGKAA